MSHSGLILVSVLVLVLAVLATHYEDKFALVTQQLHNLSATDDANRLQNDKQFASITEHLHNLSLTSDANQLHIDKLLSLFENVKFQNDQTAKAIIEASANIEIVKCYLISVLHRYILGLTPYITHSVDILDELSGNVPLVRPVFKLAHYKEKIKTKENWTSSPFLAFDGGYQLCLKVYPAGIGGDAGSYISIELYLMEGPYDDKLQQSDHWPIKGRAGVSTVT